MATDLQNLCPVTSDGNNTAVLDRNSRDLFDNHYFQNLLNGKGLLGSDQLLISSDAADTTSTKTLVQSYSSNSNLFLTDFTNSMIKMGNISPLTGSAGEIRKNCRVVNSWIISTKCLHSQKSCMLSKLSSSYNSMIYIYLSCLVGNFFLGCVTMVKFLSYNFRLIMAWESFPSSINIAAGCDFSSSIYTYIIYVHIYDQIR